jgi:hypothetical protein
MVTGKVRQVVETGSLCRRLRIEEGGAAWNIDPRVDRRTSSSFAGE